MKLSFAFAILFSIFSFQSVFASTSLLRNHADEMSRPWLDVFPGLESRLSKNKSYVFLVALPPRIVLDLRSPEHLKTTLLEMRSSDFFLGHFFVGWRCSIPTGTEAGVTGITGEHSEQGRRLFETGWGASAFVSTYTDGYLQTPEDLRYVAPIVLAKENTRFLLTAFAVDEQTCLQVPKKAKSFLLHPAKPWLNFGIMVSPEKNQGGGCGSFAYYLLNHLSVMKDSRSGLWRTLHFNPELFGHRLYEPNDVIPFSPFPADSPANPVTVFDLRDKNWQAQGRGVPVSIMDPEMMILLTKTLAENGEGQASKAIAQRLARVTSGSSATPLNRTFDAKAAQVIDSARRFADAHPGTRGIVGNIYDAVIAE